MKYFLLFISFMMVSCNNSKSTSNQSKEVDIVGNYEVIFVADIEDVVNKNVTINFSSDGKVNGNNSCNNYGGDYKVENNGLSFGMMMMTRKFCQENAKIETTFMQNLEEIDAFKIQEDMLILLQGNTPKIKAKKMSKNE